jgi:hypothetical protein
LSRIESINHCQDGLIRPQRPWHLMYINKGHNPICKSTSQDTWTQKHKRGLKLIFKYQRNEAMNPTSHQFLILSDASMDPGNAGKNQGYSPQLKRKRAFSITAITLVLKTCKVSSEVVPNALHGAMHAQFRGMSWCLAPLRPVLRFDWIPFMFWTNDINAVEIKARRSAGLALSGIVTGFVVTALWDAEIINEWWSSKLVLVSRSHILVNLQDARRIGDPQP